MVFAAKDCAKFVVGEGLGEEFEFAVKIYWNHEAFVKEAAPEHRAEVRIDGERFAEQLSPVAIRNVSQM